MSIGGNGSWYASGYGGVGYVNSFTNSIVNTVYVFSDNLAKTARYIGEAASHEAGHTLGLYHDGQDPTTEYYQGHGNWAPIMGVGYYKQLTQWSQGEYADADNQNDDLAMIADSVGGGFRTDDHGDATGSASALTANGSILSGEGIIERTTDVDTFVFTIGAGTVSLSIDPASWGSVRGAYR